MYVVDVDIDVDGYIYGQLNEWMINRWVTKCVNGKVDVQIGTWMDRWVGKWIYQCMEGDTGRWMGGWEIGWLK